jgi:hypothetical protein
MDLGCCVGMCAAASGGLLGVSALCLSASASVEVSALRDLQHCVCRPGWWAVMAAFCHLPQSAVCILHLRLLCRRLLGAGVLVSGWACQALPTIICLYVPTQQELLVPPPVQLFSSMHLQSMLLLRCWSEPRMLAVFALWLAALDAAAVLNAAAAGVPPVCATTKSMLQ